MMWDRRAGINKVVCSVTLEGEEDESSGPVAGLVVKPAQNLVLTNSFDGHTRILDPRKNLEVVVDTQSHNARATRIDATDNGYMSASFDSTLRLMQYR